MNYYETLKKIHHALRPKMYLEIGIRAGESLQLASGDTKCIGIDPDYDLRFPYLESTVLFKGTSDDFFAKSENTKIFNSDKIDLAFIDGMHLFEFALRDFMNIEKLSKKDSFIAIHDCIVKSKATSTRRRKTSYWTGDVWKVIKILERYRPDLNIVILDSLPSGLALITNLDPESKILENNYKKIVSEYMKLEYSGKQKVKAISAEVFDFNSLASKKRIVKNPLINRLMLRNNPKALGVLLCYNDADILSDVIDHLISNKHDVIVWDHGSTDTTSSVLSKYSNRLIEYKLVPRSFDFYLLYPIMSRNLIDNYIDRYDWISWPDQDEILEGPDRKKSYYNYIKRVYRSKYNWIQFNNFNYWHTEKDNANIKSPIKRIKYYSLFPDVSPRIRSWRARVTNIRRFNHNSLEGLKYPINFNLRHYPMRSAQQMKRRLTKDRANIQRGNQNFHYNNMAKNLKRIKIKSQQLHFDDGSELNHEVKFDWNKIYRNSDSE